jgi:hypothetical protein
VIDQVEHVAAWADKAGVIAILAGLNVVQAWIIMAGFNRWREDVRLFASVVDATAPAITRAKKAIADLRRDVDDLRDPPRSKRGGK